MKELSTAKALVLKRVDLREADQLVRLYTAERGKLTMAVSGAKSRAKHAFHQLDYGRVLAIEFRERDGDILPLVAVSIQEEFGAWVSSLDAFRTYCAMLELVDSACLPGLPNERVFDLLVHCGRGLSRGQRPLHLFSVFQAKLLKVLGYSPSLLHCPQCGGDFQGSGGFLVDELFCRSCAQSLYAQRSQRMAKGAVQFGRDQQADGLIAISDAELFWLQQLVSLTPGQLAAQGFYGLEMPAGVHHVLTGLCRHHFGRTPRSLEGVAGF